MSNAIHQRPGGKHAGERAKEVVHQPSHIGRPVFGTVRLQVAAMVVEEAVDGGLEVGAGTGDSALETAIGQDGDEAADVAEPGCRQRLSEKVLDSNRS